MKKQTSWGNVAEWYDEALEKRPGTYQKEVILPHVQRLVGTQKKTILDVACGQGFFSREMAKLNPANTVIASDISAELVEIAKNNPDLGARHIDYHVSPASDISFCADASVDTILISLAIQNIEDINKVFAECARVLRSGSGQFILILNHPAFRIPKRSSWGWEEVRGNPRQYRRIDAYMSESREEIDMTPGEKSEANKEYTVSFHRPLQVYMKALAKAGFVLSRLEEWVSHKKSEPGPRASEEDRMRKEIPMFLMMELKKIS